MDVDDIARIRDTHRATVRWRNGVTTFVCLCGGDWPCRVLLLADDALRERVRQAHVIASYLA